MDIPPSLLGAVATGLLGLAARVLANSKDSGEAVAGDRDVWHDEIGKIWKQVQILQDDNKDLHDENRGLRRDFVKCIQDKGFVEQEARDTLSQLSIQIAVLRERLAVLYPPNTPAAGGP